MPDPSEPDVEPDAGEPLQSEQQERSRGPGAFSVALESLVLTCTGGVIDGFTSGELGLWFALGFVASSVLTAVTVRREDLLAAAVLPPLVFAASVLLTSPAVPGGSGGGLRRQLLELASTLALQAPLLFAATAVAAVIALVRWWRGRDVAAPEPTGSPGSDGQDVADA